MSASHILGSPAFGHGLPVRCARGGSLILALVAALAISTEAEAQAQSRFSDARLVVGRGFSLLRGRADHFDTVKGTLVSDSSARKLRFEVETQVRFATPFESLVALRYEVSKYPPRAFLPLFRSHQYLTVHYTDSNGDPLHQVIRLDGENISEALETIERDTGLRVDQRPTRASFLGVPLHVRMGTTVAVTDAAGRKTKGPMTQLSASGIGVGPAVSFDAADVRRIEVVDSIWDGTAIGAIVAFQPGLVCMAYAGTGDCWRTTLALAAGGALIGLGLDAAVRRLAYEAGDVPATGVHVTPIVGRDRTGLALSISWR